MAEHKRKIIIVDKEFQYGQILAVVLITILATNSVIIVSYFLMYDQVAGVMRRASWAIALVELLLILGVIYYGAKASHRIAGPIFVLKRSLGALADGNLTVRMRLRDKDKLMDVRDAFNATADSLDQRMTAIRSSLKDVRDNLKQQGVDTSGIDQSLEELGYFATTVSAEATEDEAST